MATHSRSLAWRIAWTGEPGRLQSTGSQSQTQLRQLSMHTQESPRLVNKGVNYQQMGHRMFSMTCLHRPERHLYLTKEWPWRSVQERNPPSGLDIQQYTSLSILFTSRAGLKLVPTQSHERRRQWHPIPVLLPGKSHGRRSLVGCSPWGR